MRGLAARHLVVAALLSLAAFEAGSVLAASPQKKGRTARKIPAKPRARATPALTPTPADPSAPPPSPSPVVAGPSESDAAKLARIRARREAVQREIEKLKSQAESALRDLDSIDLDLRLAAHQLDEAELEFKETTRALDGTLKDIQVARERIAATKPRVMKSLAALGKLGELSYARLLFSLDDPADILRGYRYVSRIASADGEQIRGFRANLAELGVLEAQLKDRTARNLETRRRLQSARGALSARRTHKEDRLAEIGRERQLQEDLAEDYQRREAEILRLLGENAGSGETGAAQPQAPAAPFQTDQPLRARKGDLPWPVGGTLVKKFGVERDPKFGTRTIQQGIEIDAFPEIEVHAVHAGRIVFADHFVGYGMLVIVDHGNREHTLYGRLGELKVTAGFDVAEGSLLGLLPNTRVTGTGLHFEVRIQGKPEDPLDWLRKP